MERYSIGEHPVFKSGQRVKALVQSKIIDCEILGCNYNVPDVVVFWIVRDIKKVISPSKDYPFEVFSLPHTAFMKE